MNPLSIRVLALAAVPGALSAQRYDEGPIVGTPASVLADPTTPLANGTDGQRGIVYSKKAGFEAVRAPRPRTDPMRPDFSARAILGPASSQIEIDAMSIGLDRIPLRSCSTVLDYSTCNCWTSLAFSVEKETVTAGSASVFARELGRPGGVGADLFGYVSTSNLLGPRPPFVERLPMDFTKGRRTRLLDAIDLGLFDPMRPANEGQIVAVDLFMSLFDLESAIVSRYYALRGNPRVYFSVTASTASHLPPPFLGGSMPSGSTIYQAEWDPGTMTWQPRPPLFLASALDLEDADIDALAYDQLSGNAVISLDLQTTPTRLSHLSQLLAVTFCPTLGGPGLMVDDYKETVAGSDRPVAAGAGVGDGIDVTGTCEDDPSGGQFPIVFHSLLIGTPQPKVVPGLQDLESSVFRDCDASGNPVLSIQVSGGQCNAPGLSNFVALITFPGVLPHLDAALGSRPRACEGVSYQLAGLPAIPTMSGFPLVVAVAELRGSGFLLSREFVINL